MFPEGFLIGFSLSGFQAEMGKTGKDEGTDWWQWVHDGRNIRDGTVSGDLPENGPAYWDNYAKLHEIAAGLHMNAARLGVEWSRIFPEGAKGLDVSVSYSGDDITGIDLTESDLQALDAIADSKAVGHYRSIFRDVKDRGMTLIINLYHWSMPKILHDPVSVRDTGFSANSKGWLDSNTVIEFSKYAAYAAWKFSDLGDMFSVMNEPNVIYGNGYINTNSGFPPSFRSMEAANLAKKHLIEACARSVPLIRRFTGKPVGLIYANADIQPLSDADREAAELATHQDRYSFIDPLMKPSSFEGGSMEMQASSREGHIKGRGDLKCGLDWIGVNYYTRLVIRKKGDGYEAVRGYGHLATAGSPSSAGREVSDIGWEVYPEGLYRVLEDYNSRYKIPLFVTENGLADSEDSIRERYIVSHLMEVERALDEGFDIRGYMHWSLIDNFEWSLGFAMKFGLLGFNNDSKETFIRNSAHALGEIASKMRVTNHLRNLLDRA